MIFYEPVVMFGLGWYSHKNECMFTQEMEVEDVQHQLSSSLELPENRSDQSCFMTVVGQSASISMDQLIGIYAKW